MGTIYEKIQFVDLIYFDFEKLEKKSTMTLLPEHFEYGLSTDGKFDEFSDRIKKDRKFKEYLEDLLERTLEKFSREKIVFDPIYKKNIDHWILCLSFPQQYEYSGIFGNESFGTSRCWFKLI